MLTKEEMAERIRLGKEKKAAERERIRVRQAEKRAVQEAADKQAALSFPVNVKEPVQQPAGLESVVVEPVPPEDSLEALTEHLDDMLEEHPAKKKASTPWKPSRILDLPAVIKRPGMVPRWVNTEKPGNIKKKIADGWDFVKVKESARKQLNMTLHDSIGVDGNIRMRELVLMWMPQEMADERAKYFRELGNVDSTAMRRQLQSNIGDKGAGVYTRHPLATEDMNKTEVFGR
jgi:hypothetical protein